MKEFPTHTATFITMYDVQQIMGFGVSEFDFLQMAENDSYQVLDISDEGLWERMEELAWERNRFNEPRVRRLENEVELIQRLRAQGLTNSVLVWVSW